MARGKRFAFICGSSSATSRQDRASSVDSAPQDEKMPTSQPMQRSTESRWGTDTGLSYSDSDASITSDSSAQFDVSTPPTEASSNSYTPYGGLHDPPNPDHASLLRKTRSNTLLTFRHRRRSIKLPSLTTR